MGLTNAGTRKAFSVIYLGLLTLSYGEYTIYQARGMALSIQRRVAIVPDPKRDISQQSGSSPDKFSFEGHKNPSDGQAVIVGNVWS